MSWERRALLLPFKQSLAVPPTGAALHACLCASPGRPPASNRLPRGPGAAASCQNPASGLCLQGSPTNLRRCDNLPTPRPSPVPVTPDILSILKARLTDLSFHEPFHDSFSSLGPKLRVRTYCEDAKLPPHHSTSYLAIGAVAASSPSTGL